MVRNPGKDRDRGWKVHIIDSVRHAHSLSVGDVDEDGELEIICAEHDPCLPYRTRCNMYLYKKAKLPGEAWTRKTLDGRHEHHCGAKLVDLGNGRTAIISHGWVDSIYLHVLDIQK